MGEDLSLLFNITILSIAEALSGFTFTAASHHWMQLSGIIV